MNPTGITRRVDDLGRVVMPKEIRRTLLIREGDPLEFFVSDDGVLLKKVYTEDGISSILHDLRAYIENDGIFCRNSELLKKVGEIEDMVKQLE